MTAPDEYACMLAQARARESDPAVMAAALDRAREIAARLPRKTLTGLARRAVEEPRLAKKILWLRRLADAVEPAIKGLTACREGCAHCCHTPVLLTRPEAARIAKESGATLLTPSGDANCANDDYIGLPCPFLVDQRCSIYAFRPFACRTYYNLDADNLLCRLIPGELVRVPLFDNTQWLIAYHSAYHPRSPVFFDIRDFFGKEPAHVKR